MKKEKHILFAIDGSDFSVQALLRTGELLNTDESFKIVLFHGAAGTDLSSCQDLIGQDSGSMEKHQEFLNSEAQKVLENAREQLIKSGYPAKRLSLIFEEKCRNPAASLMKRADSPDIETIALGRWGKSSVSRQIIGSVTYRTAYLADNKTVWIIDPRISSSNVLIGLVGAPISQRVEDYAVRYFSHLKDCRFTLFHVIPPLPPEGLDTSDLMNVDGDAEQQKQVGQKMVANLRAYTDKVKEIANDSREKLLKAGIPEKNIVFKMQPRKRGIARDIIEELEQGDHGILVIGRRGIKDIREFGMGSKANKLLLTARAFIVCMVN